MVDSPKERPGRLTQALLQSAVGVSGGRLLDDRGIRITSAVGDPLEFEVNQLLSEGSFENALT